ncbi:hypothetical protein AHAS_Ahas06G0091300 [Arachis hypogaea]
MVVHGVALNDVRFIGLLSACSHEGMMSVGVMLFKAMAKGGSDADGKRKKERHVVRFRCHVITPMTELDQRVNLSN